MICLYCARKWDTTIQQSPCFSLFSLSLARSPHTVIIILNRFFSNNVLIRISSMYCPIKDPNILFFSLFLSLYYPSKTEAKKIDILYIIKRYWCVRLALTAWSSYPLVFFCVFLWSMYRTLLHHSSLPAWLRYAWLHSRHRRFAPDSYIQFVMTYTSAGK